MPHASRLKEAPALFGRALERVLLGTEVTVLLWRPFAPPGVTTAPHPGVVSQGHSCLSEAAGLVRVPHMNMMLEPVPGDVEGGTSLQGRQVIWAPLAEGGHPPLSLSPSLPPCSLGAPAPSTMVELRAEQLPEQERPQTPGQ